MPVLRAGSPAHPRLMKSIDPYRQCLKPLLDQILITLRQSGQVAHTIDEKRRLRGHVSQPADRETRLLDPFYIARYLKSKQQFRLDVDRGVQPLLFSLDCHCDYRRQRAAGTSTAGLGSVQQPGELTETPLDVSK